MLRTTIRYKTAIRMWHAWNMCMSAIGDRDYELANVLVEEIERLKLSGQVVGLQPFMQKLFAGELRRCAQR